MKRFIAMILAGCTMVSLLAGCSGNSAAASGSASGSAQKVTLRVATQTLDREKAVTYKVLQEFQKDYPNVTIQLEESPGNDEITKVNTDIMADNTPDLFTFWRPEAKWSVDKYIAKGALADLTDLVKTDPFFKDLFPDYAWKTATVDGKIYCIPRESFYMEFLVNKSIFDKNSIPMPTDWDSLVNACKLLNAKGIVPWAVDTKEGLDDSSRLFNAIMNRVVGNQKGQSLLQGKESFQQPDVLTALGYFQQITTGYAPQDAASLSFDQVVTKYLNTGKAGMILGNNTQVDVNLTNDILPDLVPLDFPLTPKSVIDKPSAEQDVTNLVYISSKAYADAVKKPYVTELMKRLVSNETAKRYVEEERWTVPNLHVDVDKSKITSLQVAAGALAQKTPGDKWLLSFSKPGPVDEFRIVINESWDGKYGTPQDLAKALDDALFNK